ncbi:MAG: DegV family protein [Clostridia bacterium]|nr:DegV family protein [Clostridia bacterium]
MSKIAIVTDTNSGITIDQAKEMGIHLIAMPFMINKEEFYEGINLSKSEFYQRLEDSADIKTSQPSPEDTMNLWDELLKEHESVVYIPMSSGLSSSCHNAVMLANEYEGKVFVVDNQRISVTQLHSVLDALKMREQGLNAKDIKQKLEDTKFESSIYITLDTLYYLKKGGRITPAAAAIGTVLKLKPVLQIQGEKLDAFAKARTMTQAKSLMINAIKNDIEKRFGGLEQKKIWLAIAHTENEEAAQVLKEELSKEIPDCEIYVDHLPLSIACHIGPGSLAIACCKEVV